MLHSLLQADLWGWVQVAEYLSNLAILHNQAGDGERAQPLYERALAIWERAYGPDHPDVAHTLTDLAVLHLEQVGLWPSAAPSCCLRGPGCERLHRCQPPVRRLCRALELS